MAKKFTVVDNDKLHLTKEELQKRKDAENLVKSAYKTDMLLNVDDTAFFDENSKDYYYTLMNELVGSESSLLSNLDIEELVEVSNYVGIRIQLTNQLQQDLDPDIRIKLTNQLIALTKEIRMLLNNLCIGTSSRYSNAMRVLEKGRQNTEDKLNSKFEGLI